MRKSVLLFLLLSGVFVFGAENPRVCLNMIVKNEKEVICRCLESVKNWIDYWVIVDTGSNDDTPNIIQEFFKDIPGELYERPWVNFAHNRNEALQLAKEKGDYLLLIDADEELVLSDGFLPPKWDKDFYLASVSLEGTGMEYKRILLIDNRIDWKWEGIIHEDLISSKAKSFEHIKNLTNRSYTSGYRSKDPQKYLKDALLLEKALEIEPNNARNVYYLAQSYFNVPDPQKALKYFQKRVEMGGWEEEVYFSLYCIASLHESLQMDEKTIIESYTKAYLSRPTRVEPLYRLAQYYMQKGNYFLAYLISKHGLSIPLSNDSMYVEKWIYEWGLYFSFAECAFKVKSFNESKVAMEYLLEQPSFPLDKKNIVNSNLQLIK